MISIDSYGSCAKDKTCIRTGTAEWGKGGGGGSFSIGLEMNQILAG